MEIKIWNDCTHSVPTVYTHAFTGDGEDVWKACHEEGCPPFNLAVIHHFDFDNDLTPWPASNVRKGEPPFSGNAPTHLEEMLRVWMPEVESRLPAPSLYVAQAGYSLAGLFTLWSTWQTDVFKRIACVSASLWYPHLFDYLTDHRPAYRPDRIYFSLGDKESRTRHPLMSQVETCTRSVHDLVREMGIPTHFEMNPGNHFTAPDKRMAKAVAWILA